MGILKLVLVLGIFIFMFVINAGGTYFYPSFNLTKHSG